ncbi:hypothetical protein AB0D22_07625 [Kitasatospora sp. NPDC048538]|uniref:hypothetical protein n=1 Tax=Kitasatospora sp. NPDC048538 TaxID=3155633 RepID=UPI003404B2E7
MPLTTAKARAEVHDRLWDLAHADWALSEFVYAHAGILRGPASRELLVLPRPAPHTEQYIIAPLLPEVLGRTTDEVEELAPHGITVDPDPPRAAAAVTGRLLPRYDRAIRQVLTDTDPIADLPWPSQDSDPAVLRNAVRTLLIVAELRLDDEMTGLAEIVSGGGDYVCERLSFDYDMAPLIEAAAIQALLATAGLGTGSLLDPDTPRHLRRLSALPAAEQHALLRRAAAVLDEPPPTPRSSAARARSAAPPPAGPAQQAAAPPSAVTSRSPAPGR